MGHLLFSVVLHATVTVVGVQVLEPAIDQPGTPFAVVLSFFRSGAGGGEPPMSGAVSFPLPFFFRRDVAMMAAEKRAEDGFITGCAGLSVSGRAQRLLVL